MPGRDDYRYIRFSQARKRAYVPGRLPACLPKPFSPEKLVETIQTVLNY